MEDVLVWPRVLYPRAISFELENTSRSGGVSTIGTERVIASGACRWTARYEGIPIMDDESILSIRALEARLRGRTGFILVPVLDWRRSPWPRDLYGRVMSPKAVRRSLLDGTRFADPEIPHASFIDAELSSAAPLRATSLSIVSAAGVTPREGHFFSIGPSLYVIAETIADGVYRIEPPLRDDAPEGTAVNFSTPACRMRLTDDRSGALTLELSRRGFADFSFTEAY